MSVGSHPLSFREAIPEDADQVVALVRSAYRGDASRAGWTTEADLFADDRVNNEMILAKIARLNDVLLLAHQHDGTLVGCCGLTVRGNGVALLGMFAVDPLLQGGGIGKKLLARTEQYASETLAVKRIEMNVISLREELVDFYLRRGYRKTGVAAPFPYEVLLVNGAALRDDLYFIVLEKSLASAERDGAKDHALGGAALSVAA